MMKQKSLSSHLPRINLSIIALALFLPTSAALAEPEIETHVLQCYINQLPYGEPTLFLKRGDEVYARAEDIDSWRFTSPTGQPLISDGQRYFALSEYHGLTYSVDVSSQNLRVLAPPQVFRRTSQSIEQNGAQVLRPERSGIFVNYDFTLDNTISPSRSNNEVSGLLSLTGFCPYGIFTSALTLRNLVHAASVFRLGTSWIIDQPESQSTLVFGDSYTTAGAFGGSVPFIGIQWKRNFGTQTGYFTGPGLAFQGEAALPSTLDLFINDARTWSTRVGAGPFSIEGIPIVNGVGEARIVTTDALGRQMVLYVPFYETASLLKPGLRDFSFDFGVTRDPNNTNFSYSDFVAAITYREGLTSEITGGMHGEFLRQQQTFGVGFDFIVSNWFEGQAALAIANSERGQGALTQFGLGRTDRWWSLGGKLTYAMEQFTSLRYFHSNRSVPKIELSAFAGARSQLLGGLSLSLTERIQYDDINTSLLTISYNNTFFRNLSFSANALLNLHDVSNFAFSVDLSFSFGEGDFVSAGASVDQNTYGGTARYSRVPSIGNGYGFDQLVRLGSDAMGSDSRVSINTSLAELQAQTNVTENQMSLRLNAAGAITRFLGETLFSRPIQNAFAVVDTGLGGVPITTGNAVMGVSNKSGILLLPNLYSYIKNDVSIDLASLPMNATVLGKSRVEVLPYLRSGVLIKFDLKITQSAIASLVLENGDFVPAGAVATLLENPSQSFVVGFDGELYLPETFLKNNVTVKWGEKSCNFSFIGTDFKGEAQTMLGRTLCRYPTVIEN